jgi:hypothetical protein
MNSRCLVSDERGRLDATVPITQWSTRALMNSDRRQRTFTVHLIHCSTLTSRVFGPELRNPRRPLVLLLPIVLAQMSEGLKGAQYMGLHEAIMFGSSGRIASGTVARWQPIHHSRQAVCCATVSCHRGQERRKEMGAENARSAFESFYH